MTSVVSEQVGLMRSGAVPAIKVRSEPSIFGLAQKMHPGSQFGVAGRMERRGIYGENGDLTEVTLHPGYHSLPHTHDCEQLTYCLDGDVWIFVENQGFHMRRGDFHRVPQNVAHWMWNRTDARCQLMTSHVPMLVPEPYEDQWLQAAFRPDEEPSRRRRGVRRIYKEFSSAIGVEARLKEFEDLRWSPFDPQLLLRGSEFPRHTLTTTGREGVRGPLGAAVARHPEAQFRMADLLHHERVRGNEGDIAHYERMSGYHSPPHFHPTGEQLNYGVSGATWIFADHEGFELRAGDFSRVPADSAHWAWNRSDKSSYWVESHVPQSTPFVGLYRSDEIPQFPPKTSTATGGNWVDPVYALEVEQKLFGEYK